MGANETAIRAAEIAVDEPEDGSGQDGAVSAIPAVPPKVRQYVLSAPLSIQNTLTRAFSDPKCSPRAAIKAKCLSCCNFDRAEVAGCTVVICPLHRFRPFQP